MSRQWSRSELGQQLRAEIIGYLGAASEFDDGMAKKLKLSRTDMRCLDLVALPGRSRIGICAIRLSESRNHLATAGHGDDGRAQQSVRAGELGMQSQASEFHRYNYPTFLVAMCVCLDRGVSGYKQQDRVEAHF